MEEEQPRTQTVQYRQITGVHLKTGIEDPDFSDPRKQFSTEDEHISDIQVADGTVLVDFDNGEGYSFPFANVSHLDYVTKEDEVEVPPQNPQPRGGQRGQRTREPQPRGGQRRR